MKDFQYPIRAVSKLTGLSIETLRAWERRYQVVMPRREGGRRLYDETDVERLRLLRAAAESGHTISRLAGMGNEELQHLIAGSGTATRQVETPLSNELVESVDVFDGILDAIGRLDYAAAEREFALLATLLPPRELVFRVALPLMRQVGDAWHAGLLSIAQEHMTSSLLRNLVGALIPLHRRVSATNKLLFVTPSGEHHETGILLSAMLAAGGGLDVIYLGPDLPPEEIVTAAHKTAPQAVVVGFVGANGAGSAIKHVTHVAERLPANIELWVGGTKQPSLVDQVRQTRALLIDDFEMLEQHLARLGARF